MNTRLTLLLLGTLLSTVSLAQSSFQHCSAAFVSGRMLVDQYSPKGTCRLNTKANGELSVWTINATDKETKAVSRIPFKVAIRDKDTQTLLLFSNDSFRQVNIRNVLTKCRKGDRIVLLTLDRQYALPHNEILVE
ncbi:hypothetical protein [Tellurirhabdus rosea]|uniref:hypothetical protein n=1 Tax=Tellurirhabdus rosea TaxID=2674997 RepID=UPI00224F2749|nr:hypothetical protein [Tellurirhabdus rosea]